MMPIPNLGKIRQNYSKVIKGDRYTETHTWIYGRKTTMYKKSQNPETDYDTTWNTVVSSVSRHKDVSTLKRTEVL